MFHPNLYFNNIRFQFRIVNLFNFIFNFGFLSLRDPNFSVNFGRRFLRESYPNSVIFDSVDLILSSLFKYIKIPNFSPQLIV